MHPACKALIYTVIWPMGHSGLVQKFGPRGQVIGPLSKYFSCSKLVVPLVIKMVKLFTLISNKYWFQMCLKDQFHLQVAEDSY